MTIHILDVIMYFVFLALLFKIIEDEDFDAILVSVVIYTIAYYLIFGVSPINWVDILSSIKFKL